MLFEPVNEVWTSVKDNNKNEVIEHNENENFAKF